MRKFVPITVGSVPPRRRTLTGSIAAIAALASQSARASNTWDGGAGGTYLWSDPGNWGGSAPNYGIISFFGSIGTTNILDGNLLRAAIPT